MNLIGRLVDFDRFVFDYALIVERKSISLLYKQRQIRATMRQRSSSSVSFIFLSSLSISPFMYCAAAAAAVAGCRVILASTGRESTSNRLHYTQP